MNPNLKTGLVITGFLSVAAIATAAIIHFKQTAAPVASDNIPHKDLLSGPPAQTIDTSKLTNITTLKPFSYLGWTGKVASNFCCS